MSRSPRECFGDLTLPSINDRGFLQSAPQIEQAQDPGRQEQDDVHRYKECRSLEGIAVKGGADQQKC
jgi:hypothetical protein